MNSVGLRRLVSTAAIAVVSAGLWMAFDSTGAQAGSCGAGKWKNEDGTCTYVNYVHCNINGKKWQCPRHTPTCVLKGNGNTACKKD